MTNRRKLWAALTTLIGLHGLVLFAGFFAPYDFSAQNRTIPFAPPTRIHFADVSGTLHLRPFVYSLVPKPGEYDSYEEDRSRMYPLRFLVPGASYEIGGMFGSRIHLIGVDDPARILLLGSDEYGRDQFSRLLYGGQISLVTGLLAAALSLGLGLVMGALSGFYGKGLDAIVMRFAELFLALPWLYLLFAIRAFLPLHVTPPQAFLSIIMVIGLVGWARPARLIRGVVLSAKERGYVTAARGFGASNAYLLRRHVLPQTLGVTLTQATLLIPQYILAEVTLSFLGLGVGEPQPSWGNMLASLQQYHVLASYWWMLAPGLALIPVFLAYFAMAGCLQEHVKYTAL